MQLHAKMQAKLGESETRRNFYQTGVQLYCCLLAMWLPSESDWACHLKPSIQLNLPLFFFRRLLNLSSASLMLSRLLSKSTTSSPSCPTPSSSVEVRRPCDCHMTHENTATFYHTDVFKSDYTF